MPLPPANPYFKFTCRSCDWSVVIMQTSDVIVAPGICKKCGSTGISRTQASFMTLVANRWHRR